jgi:hypothetical protein
MGSGLLPGERVEISIDVPDKVARGVPEGAVQSALEGA